MELHALSPRSVDADEAVVYLAESGICDVCETYHKIYSHPIDRIAENRQVTMADNARIAASRGTCKNASTPDPR